MFMSAQDSNIFWFENKYRNLYAMKGTMKVWCVKIIGVWRSHAHMWCTRVMHTHTHAHILHILGTHLQLQVWDVFLSDLFQPQVCFLCVPAHVYGAPSSSSFSLIDLIALILFWSSGWVFRTCLTLLGCGCSRRPSGCFLFPLYLSESPKCPWHGVLLWVTLTLPFIDAVSTLYWAGVNIRKQGWLYYFTSFGMNTCWINTSSSTSSVCWISLCHAVKQSTHKLCSTCVHLECV